jgi:hypothetical protein
LEQVRASSGSQTQHLGCPPVDAGDIEVRATGAHQLYCLKRKSHAVCGNTVESMF